MEHHTQNKLLPDNIFLSYIQCEKYLRSASASTFFHTWNEQSVFKDYSEKYFWEKSTRYPKMWWLEKYFSVSYNSKGIQDQNIPLSSSEQELGLFCLNREICPVHISVSTVLQRRRSLLILRNPSFLCLVCWLVDWSGELSFTFKSKIICLKGSRLIVNRTIDINGQHICDVCVRLRF